MAKQGRKEQHLQTAIECTEREQGLSAGTVAFIRCTEGLRFLQHSFSGMLVCPQHNLSDHVLDHFTNLSFNPDNLLASTSTKPHPTSIYTCQHYLSLSPQLKKAIVRAESSSISQFFKSQSADMSQVIVAPLQYD